MGGCVSWPQGGLPLLQKLDDVRCFNMCNPDSKVLGVDIPQDWALWANRVDKDCIGRVPIDQPDQPVKNIMCSGVGHDYWPHVHALLDMTGCFDDRPSAIINSTWQPK